MVLLIDKPLQWTSFQVVNRLKWHLRRTFGLKKFKIGHAGTLDPMATGLLLVCVGKDTKRIEQLQAGIKEYSGTMVLGATTPCFDLEQAVDNYYPFEHITPESIEAARLQFVGPLQQVPPMFSAVKVDGKRAYISARDGKPCDIAPKPINIYDFTVTAFRPSDPTRDSSPPIANAHNSQLSILNSEPSAPHLYRNPQGTVPEGLPQIDFRITCSKGTYIRSIARDFGEALGSGAFLSALRRERIGDYSVADALQLDAIKEVITPSNPAFGELLQTS